MKRAGVARQSAPPYAFDQPCLLFSEKSGFKPYFRMEIQLVFHNKPTISPDLQSILQKARFIPSLCSQNKIPDVFYLQAT
jgi:hypothetical protein